MPELGQNVEKCALAEAKFLKQFKVSNTRTPQVYKYNELHEVNFSLNLDYC